MLNLRERFQKKKNRDEGVVFRFPSSMTGKKVIEDEQSVEENDGDIESVGVSVDNVSVKVEDNKGVAVPVSSVASSSGAGSGKLDVRELFSKFGQKSVTTEQNTKAYMESDEHLSMKTEVHDPVGMSLWDMIGADAERKGYSMLAASYRKYGKAFRENMVSFNRGGRREFKEIAIADREFSRQEEAGVS